MKYKNIVQGIFVDRPNRFIANVLIDGKTETVHVKNTGRCKELLIRGCTVWLEKSDNPLRKTKYDLVAVEKKCGGQSHLLINMDSQLPNIVVGEWLGKSGLFEENSVIKHEVKYGSSRLDFCVEETNKTSFIEVKGVTLERGGIAYFPDAPTERGVKHINELIKCHDEGFGAYILFVIQMKGVTELRPNDETHREFGEALRTASDSGVECLAFDCIVTANSVDIDRNIPVML